MLGSNCGTIQTGDDDRKTVWDAGNGRKVEYHMIRERNENIDFLRLISMFFVVCVHYVGWGVFHQIQ